MIELKKPLNYGGSLIPAGTKVGFIPVEMQKKLIENGAAVPVKPEVVQKAKNEEDIEKPIEKMNREELLKKASALKISDIPDDATKADIRTAIADKLQAGNEKEKLLQKAAEFGIKDIPDDATTEQIKAALEIKTKE
jgi:hypothetical protein